MAHLPDLPAEAASLLWTTPTILMQTTLKSFRYLGVTALLATLPLLSMQAATPSPTPGKDKKAAASASGNPILAESKLPYHMPPFDKVKNEHFAPAYEAALAKHLKEIEAITEVKDEPTIENTLIAMERSGRDLFRVDVSLLQSGWRAHQP